MTDKERLQDIKNRFMKYEYDYALSGDDVEWLIQQAERVEELELEINDWKDEVRKWQQFYEESEESHLETKELLHSTSSVVKRYRQALEEILNADCNLEGLDAERELDRVTDIALKALEEEI